MGRPAVATALISTFEANSTTKGTAKDGYNQDVAQTGWSAKYKAEMSGNLAVYDGLDQNCNNQLAASGDAGAQNSNALKYGFLGGVLADDRLWLNTGGTACDTYLGVEANVLGITNNDCGGRALKYDVIDVTYSAVAIGALTGVGDNVVKDDVKTAATAFPFLAAPTP